MTMYLFYDAYCMGVVCCRPDEAGDKALEAGSQWEVLVTSHLHVSIKELTVRYRRVQHSTGKGSGGRREDGRMIALDHQAHQQITNKCDGQNHALKW